tara:strand:+ start:465 stop:590 length:126 start_codon:yes stop_codon:yes gene_type:complete
MVKAALQLLIHFAQHLEVRHIQDQYQHHARAEVDLGLAVAQ